MSTSNVQLTITSDVLTAHEWSPPCDWNRVEVRDTSVPLGQLPTPCDRPAFWAVRFGRCPTPGCNRVTAPALWCRTHLVHALDPDCDADCECCGRKFKPFLLLIDHYEPIKGPPQ